MNTEQEKPTPQLNSCVNRRSFISGALTTGIFASAIPSRAVELSPNEAGSARGDAAQSAIPPAVLHQLQTRPPLRVGLRRVFDPSVGEKEEWYINDHTFIRDDSGTWHLFGITGREPANPQNEKVLLHATAKELLGPWTKHQPVMQADSNAGETVVWAPYVFKHDRLYWMFYCGGGASHGRYQINLATSSDLSHWTRSSSNPIIVDGYDARDPMVLRVGSTWVLYYCATESPGGGNHVVIGATSSDLNHWSGRQIVFRSSQAGTFGGPTESPFVVQKGNLYYLFLCTNSPYANTEVYVSDSPFHWNEDDVVLRFDAHAAEVVEGDGGVLFLSSAGWGQGGLYLAELRWNNSPSQSP